MSFYRFLFDHKMVSVVFGSILVQGMVLATGWIPSEKPLSRDEIALPEVAENRVDRQERKKIALNLRRLSTRRSSEQDTRLNKRTYRVEAGDTLTKIWTKNADNYQGGILAARALKQNKIPLSVIRTGDEITLHTSEAGDIVYFEKSLKDGEKLILTGDSESGYQARRYTPKIISTKRVVSGIINQSFSNAASGAEVPYQVIDELVDLFGTRIEFRRDLQPGDSFSIVYMERALESGDKVSPGPIMAASIKNNGDLLAAVRHVGSDNKPRYYDEQGEPLGNYFLRYPLKFTRISSVFNKSRFHPILKRRKPHNGVDFAAPTGTPVRAVADGVITMAGYKGGAGKMVKISHGSRWATAYLHLSRIGRGITHGARVKRGQVIGNVGMTGYATGPHLHYSLYDRGRYVDPLRVTLPSMPNDAAPIPGDILQATVRELASQHDKLQYASLRSQMKSQIS